MTQDTANDGFFTTLRVPETEADWQKLQREAAEEQPVHSQILVQITDITRTNYGYSIAIGECQAEGRHAFWEAEASTLPIAIENLLENYDQLTLGWHLIAGFTAHYTVDYFGEHDVDYACEDVRPGTYRDAQHFGLPIPWHARLRLALKQNPLLPTTFMDVPT